MNFEEVIGQSNKKSQLLQMAQSGRMPHALLLLGAQGSGKLALAIALAQYVLCENPGKKDACGNCNSCQKSARLIHPDLHFSFPTVGTNATSDLFLSQWRLAIENNPYLNLNQWLQEIGAENRQGNINKEECKNILRKLSLKTFEGSHKVLIIWLPEFLGKEGNRLLKIIEEPPENTVFILVAENQELILNTILSRCQLVQIHPLSDDEVIEGLTTKMGVSGERARSIAYLANGNLNDAYIFAEQKENDNARLFLDWMRKCYVGNGVELVKWVEGFASLGRENQKHFLRYALHFLREYMVLKLTSNENVRLRADELTSARNLTKVIELDQIDRIMELLNNGSYYIERNANPKVLFLDISIQLNQILKRKLVEQR